MDAPLLEMRDISKSFPGVRALDRVHFDLKPGEIHALMGENGAGKSTLIKILSGVYSLDTGEILLDGQSIEPRNPTHAQSLGISPVHQELNLEPYLNVAENIFLGRQPQGAFGLIHYGRMHREAAMLLSQLGVAMDTHAMAGALSVAERQMIAIARAVSIDARILILDEPTSPLTERETELLFTIVRRLKERGFGIIYISHRLEEIFRLCDRVTVFRDGQYIATRTVAEIGPVDIISMMIGRDISDLYRKREAEIGAPVLEIRHLTKRGFLHDISLVLRRGEIVGMAGLVGAGRTELARAIFGDWQFDSGAILLEGKPIRSRSPRDAIAAGIGLVPEDRKEQGLVTGFSVLHNISMAILPRLAPFGVIRSQEERKVARRYVDRLAIRTPSVEQKVMYLSGGNQQRVVVGKWLATNPKVLIVDEPTRGIDVGAKAEIHALLSDLARQGVGILMISSDLPEILAMSDRILIMHQGRLTGEVPGKGATQEQIMTLATGQAST
jgi:ABC-type sugar transport system ATPase subunit